MYGHMGVPITTTFEEIQFVESAKAESWFQLFDLSSKHITNILYAGYHTECINTQATHYVHQKIQCRQKSILRVRVNVSTGTASITILPTPLKGA